MTVDFQSFLDRVGIKNGTELGQLVGKSQGTISLWGSGKISISIESCAKLLLLGMSVQELFGDEVAEKIVIYADNSKKPKPSSKSLLTEDDIVSIIDKKIEEAKEAIKSGKL